MAIRLLLLIAVLIVTSCSQRLDELMVNKTPYPETELRTDGYYYSNDLGITDFRLAVFYRDGICYHLFGSSDTQPIEDFIEQDILLNESFIDNLRTTPTNIGVFNIEDKSISIEHWEASRDILALERSGEILNDSTFILNQVENLQGEIENVNYTYRFKQFSPKPDSTNMFIN